MHGILALLQIGFGNALGALLSGVFYDNFGALTLFLIAAGCGTASMLSLFVSIL
jgi:hypothetical protein